MKKKTVVIEVPIRPAARSQDELGRADAMQEELCEGLLLVQVVGDGPQPQLAIAKARHGEQLGEG